jgi:hypothetical protein
MKVRNLILIVTTGLLLTFFGVDTFLVGSWSLFTHASRGKIVSIDANSLVLAHKKNGKTEELNFVLTRDTVRKGNLIVGTSVSVHYRIESNRQLATSIQAQPSKGQNAQRNRSMGMKHDIKASEFEDSRRLFDCSTV